MRNSTILGAALVGLSVALTLAGTALTGGPQKIYADLISSSIGALKHSLELTYGERDRDQSPATGPSQASSEQQIMLKWRPASEANDERRNPDPNRIKIHSASRGSEFRV